MYAFASIDLKLDGPTVVEIPPGMYGTANDAAFKYLTDFGATGPDKGEGGKYLFLPPDYEGEAPEGYFVRPAHPGLPHLRHDAGLRRGRERRSGGAVVRERLKVYPLATGLREHTVTNASGMGANTLPPEDGSAFAMLNEIIQYEPYELFSKELLGRLATLGIEKGKPFQPDERMQRIFDQAARQGVAMSRAILYASREPDINYWPDRFQERVLRGVPLLWAHGGVHRQDLGDERS